MGEFYQIREETVMINRNVILLRPRQAEKKGVHHLFFN